MIYAPLVNDVAAGRVVAIDDTRDDHILWRTNDGEVYVDLRYDPVDVDLRASVAAQPYASSNPAPIRYERIDDGLPGAGTVSGVHGLGDVVDIAGAAFVLLGLVMIGTGPEPRHLTRWGWFWLSVTGVGLLAYLLLSGSRRRTGPADARRRAGGVVGFVGTWVGIAVLACFTIPLRNATVRPNEGLHPGTVAPGTAEFLERYPGPAR